MIGLLFFADKYVHILISVENNNENVFYIRSYNNH